MKSITDLSIDELVSFYKEQAIKNWQYLSAADSKSANLCADNLQLIYKELAHRGDLAMAALLPLLSSENDSIRMWSASHALAFSPLEAERVLVELTQKKGMLGFTAKMTLGEWKKKGVFGSA